MALLKPMGPHRVGSIAQALCDDSRPAHLMSTQPGRCLLLKLWYPANPSPGATPERIWAHLRGGDRTPLVARALLGLLRHRTSTFPSAVFAAPSEECLPVLYNHGLVSFAAENTSLMEELASRGHIVIAVEHRDQLVELRALQRGAPGAQNIDKIVRERAQDTRFVLDRLASVLTAIPGGSGASSPAGRVWLAGYSLGGAVGTVVAEDDARPAGVISLDGGTQGSSDPRRIGVPYLMLYSAPNEGINAAQLPALAHRETFAGTTHLNFHDVAGLLPVLRWFGVTGRADPLEVLRGRNRRVAKFCSNTALGQGG